MTTQINSPNESTEKSVIGWEIQIRGVDILVYTNYNGLE